MATATISSPDAPAAARLAIRRRRPLPAGRAVVGAFLIAASLVGLFAAYSRATAGPSTGYVVAARDLRIGDTIRPSDVALATMNLPAAIATRRAYRSPATLVGATVVGPIARGELVQASAVLARAAGAGGAEVSLGVDEANAVGGDLVEGELVDVLVTYGTGRDAVTLTVVHHARVVAVDAGGGGLGGGSGMQVVTLRVPTADDARAVAHASAAGHVALIRSSGTAGAAGEHDGRPGGGT